MFYSLEYSGPAKNTKMNQETQVLISALHSVQRSICSIRSNLREIQDLSSNILQALRVAHLPWSSHKALQVTYSIIVLIQSKVIPLCIPPLESVRNPEENRDPFIFFISNA